MLTWFLSRREVPSVEGVNERGGGNGTIRFQIQLDQGSPRQNTRRKVNQTSRTH